MKTHLLRFLKPDLQVKAGILTTLAFLVFFGQSSFAQITGTTPASRCGEGTVVLHATAGSGTIKWYDVPFYGTAIATGVTGGGTTFTTPALAVTKTYYVDAVDGSNCSLNSGSIRVPVIATISASSIQAGIFYQSTTFCKSVNTPQAVTRTGTAGGVYSYTGSGGTLTLNASTGEITPGTSTVGTYTITYTVTAAEGCVENPASTQVTITNAPLTSSISYTGTPFCTSATSATVTLTNNNNGTFSASPSGLSINSVSGTINPSLSLPGTYTVTYTVSGAGGCAPQAPTASVTITGLPTASVSYSGAPYCKDIATAQTPVLTGTGVYTGGTYSATGITINASTGAITPSTSTAGTYTIYYTVPASGNCASVQTSTSLTIYPLPTAGIAGTTSVCQNATEPDITFTGNTGTAPFTFTYTVNGGGEQTITTTSGSSVTESQSTVSAGTYEYSLVSVSDANGCTKAASGTATITVTGNPVATFLYPNSPYCKTGTASPLLTGGASAGTFTGTGVTFDNAATGVIDLTSTPAGTYTITNTINGCGNVSAQSTITINSLPDISISGTLTSCGTTTLTANTAALSPTYTWYKDNVEISGQTASSLVVDASGSYKVKVSDGTTNCDKTSAASVVTINPSPTASINGTLTACLSTTLTAVTDAVNKTYIWYLDDVVIAGQTASTLVASQSGYYTVRITNTATTCYKISDPVAVTINSASQGGNIVGSQSVCTGTNSTTLILQSYSGDIVRWESSTDQTHWTTIVNTTGSYTATNLTTTTYYRAVVKNGDCSSDISTTATLTVLASPAWATVTQPASSVTYGSSVTFSATVSGGNGGSISWVRSTTSGGAGTTVTSPDTPPAAGTYYYRPKYSQSVLECTLADGTEKTVTVDPKALTASSTINDKIYNGTASTGTVSLGTITGLIGTETLTITPSTVNYASANVGTGKASTISYVLADGTNGGKASNYTMADISASGNITKKPITITPDDGQMKVYGVVDPTLTYTNTPLIGTDAITGSLSYTNAAQYATAGYWSYTIGSLTAGSNYQLTVDNTKTFFISKIQLTISGTVLTTDKTYDGTDNAAVTPGTLSGIINSDVVTVSAIAKYTGTGVEAGLTITVNYNLGGANAANYQAPVSYSVNTGIIRPVAPTGTATQTFCSASLPN